MRRIRILILGGGFGGAYTAMALERRLRRRADVEVALVSRENYLVFQPLLPEVVGGSIGLLDTIAPLRRLCPRTRFYTRDIDAIDLVRRVVTLKPGFEPRPLELSYEHLVVALGNATAMGLPGVREHALPFKTLGDALHLRNHVLHVLEEAAIEHDAETRRALTTFVVAGGGFSGVEVAAELNDFVREVVRDYRGIEVRDLRVVLLHARDRLLPELDARLARFAERALASRGVEIRLGVRLAAATRTAAVLEGGERLATRTLVTTVPVAPNPLIAALPVTKHRDRVVVDATLAVDGAPAGVWAVGDCAAVPAAAGGLAPTTAQHAIREARTVAANIVAALDGRPAAPFTFAGLGHLASLGRRSAVARILGVNISGLPAWWLWRTIYLLKLPGLDRKLRVAIDWTLDLFLRHDIVQLKTDRSAAIAYEHFDAGEMVVREGELGDKLYIIKTGDVEVVRTGEQERVQVSRLGPGEYFGEMALLTNAPRNASVRCLTPVDVLVVGRGDFLALVGTFPELRRVFEDLARRRTPTPTRE